MLAGLPITSVCLCNALSFRTWSIQNTLNLPASIHYAHAMDEIAPEYDVVVLGTGSWSPTPPASPQVDWLPTRLDRMCTFRVRRLNRFQDSFLIDEQSSQCQRQEGPTHRSQRSLWWASVPRRQRSLMLTSMAVRPPLWISKQYEANHDPGRENVTYNSLALQEVWQLPARRRTMEEIRQSQRLEYRSGSKVTDGQWRTHKHSCVDRRYKISWVQTSCRKLCAARTRTKSHSRKSAIKCVRGFEIPVDGYVWEEKGQRLFWVGCELWWEEPKHT